MTNQESSITEILSLIDKNNIIKVHLPVLNTEVEIKRYSVDSLNVINDIFEKETNSEIMFQYFNYLIELVKDRTTLNLDYIDFLHLIFCLRAEENNEYKETNLQDVISNIKENVKLDSPKPLKIKDGIINYKVNFSIPKISNLEDTIKQCNTATKDLIFYNIFKYIDNIEISAQDKTTKASSKEELYQLYNAISYRSLDKINKQVNNITNKIYNLYNVNIEADTSFLYSI
jgi:hypothetical protein